MYKYIKRLMDIILSSITLLLLTPLLLPIVVALKVTAEGEILYLQKRRGFKNEYFDIWKFATMLKNSPNMLTGSITLRNDPRVTPIGKYLRITKLNELPQIVNVLKGDMSIVGPRPQMERDFQAYSKEVQSKIYNVKPGITGLGSIIFRDEEKMLSESDLPAREFYDDIIAPYKGELELWYQENISFITDLKIIFVTAWVILFPHSKIVNKIFNELPERPVALQIDKR